MMQREPNKEIYLLIVAKKNKTDLRISGEKKMCRKIQQNEKHCCRRYANHVYQKYSTKIDFLSVSWNVQLSDSIARKLEIKWRRAQIKKNERKVQPHQSSCNTQSTYTPIANRTQTSHDDPHLI